MLKIAKDCEDCELTPAPGKLVLICSQDSTNPHKDGKPAFCARFWGVVFCCGTFCARVPVVLVVEQSMLFCGKPPVPPVGCRQKRHVRVPFLSCLERTKPQKPLVVPPGERRKKSSYAGSQKDRCQGKHDKKCMIVWSCTYGKHKLYDFGLSSMASSELKKQDNNFKFSYMLPINSSCFMYAHDNEFYAPDQKLFSIIQSYNLKIPYFYEMSGPYNTPSGFQKSPKVTYHVNEHLKKIVCLKKSFFSSKLLEKISKFTLQ